MEILSSKIPKQLLLNYRNQHRFKLEVGGINWNFHEANIVAVETRAEMIMKYLVSGHLPPDSCGASIGLVYNEDRASWHFIAYGGFHTHRVIEVLDDL